MAGELGHWRLSDYGPTGYGKEGSFEGFCSGGGIRQLAETLALRERQKGAPVFMGPGPLTARAVAEAAAAARWRWRHWSTWRVSWGVGWLCCWTC